MASPPSSPVPARNGHWVFVGSTGVACGAVVGWLLWMLTAAIAAAFVVGGAVASILVVLAIAGTRQNETFRADAVKAERARARRRQVLDAMSETRAGSSSPPRTTDEGDSDRDGHADDRAYGEGGTGGTDGRSGPEGGRR